MQPVHRSLPIRRRPETTPGGSGRELLRAVAALELAARREAATLLGGEHRSAFVGEGLDFHESRRYLPGEPVRRIDWRITARLGEPFVQLHHEERQRRIVLAIDISDSMRYGWQRRSKLETAVLVAATLGVAASEHGDQLGWLTFDDSVRRRVLPRRARRTLRPMLADLLRELSPDSDLSLCARGSDLRAALHAVGALRGPRALVYLVSDFLDPDLEDDLRRLRRRHDTTCVRIVEPLDEAALPRRLRRWVRPAEGPTQTRFAAATANAASRALGDHIEGQLRRHSDAAVEVSTADGVGDVLRRAMERRRAGLRRRSFGPSR